MVTLTPITAAARPNAVVRVRYRIAVARWFPLMSRSVSVANVLNVVSEPQNPVPIRSRMRLRSSISRPEHINVSNRTPKIKEPAIFTAHIVQEIDPSCVAIAGAIL